MFIILLVGNLTGTAENVTTKAVEKDFAERASVCFCLTSHHGVHFSIIIYSKKRLGSSGQVKTSILKVSKYL